MIYLTVIHLLWTVSALTDFSSVFILEKIGRIFEMYLWVDIQKSLDNMPECLFNNLEKILSLIGTLFELIFIITAKLAN